MFGSSSPFGASTSSLFGGSSTPSTPFGASSSANPFGTNQAPNPFGSKPFGSSSIGGGQAGTSLFGNGTATSVFGSTQASAFNASSSAFGAASSTPAFGNTLFGQKPAATFTGFGTASGQTNPFGSPSFGQTQSAFGSQPFGSTPSFGVSTPAFGSTTPASTSAFSSGSSTFGTPSTTFGATNSTFGTAAPVFGTSAPAFGSSTTPAFTGFGSNASTSAQNAPAFGASTSSFGVSSFGGQRVGSRVTPYSATTEQESNMQVKLISISAMPSYKNKSPEELRWEDYQANDKGGTTQQGTPSFGQQPANPFGSSITQGSASSPFASSTTTSPFAPKPASAFTAPSSSLFSSGASPVNASMGQTTSLFGHSSIPSFGIGNSGAAGTSNTFAPVPAPVPSPFSSASVSAPVPGFGFTTPSLGSSSSFSFTGTQSSGLFSTLPTQAPSTPAPTIGSTGFGWPSSTQSKASMPSLSTGSSFASFPSPAFAPNAGASTGSVFLQPQTGSGGSIFGGSPAPPAMQSISQQPAQNTLMAPSVVVSSPFGSMPTLPQISVGHTTGPSVSVQYGISSIPISDKPTPVRSSSLLTPRQVTPRSKLRMHARKYYPKKDSPKVSFFSDGEETSTPKADVSFVPRENPRALFIRQPDQPPSTPVSSKAVPESVDNNAPMPYGDSLDNWASAPDVVDSDNQDVPHSSKSVDAKNSLKFNSKQNCGKDDHNYRGNGYISMTGHRAGEAAIAYEHGADIEALMPKLRHSDYYTEPRIQELAAKERAEPGYCRRVKEFIVGRKGYGHVKFLGETDVRRLDLESIIQFNRCEVLVYMDESKKPPAGQGLNKPAEVLLLNVKCPDKRTGQYFTEGPEVEKFRKKLKKKTEEQGAEFVSYDAAKGEWTFRVKHFSRYGLDDSDDDDMPVSVSEKALVLMNKGVEVIEEDNHYQLDSGFQVENKILQGDSIQAMMDDEAAMPDGLGSRVTGSALPHSLPAQLGLDPVKMQQLKMLFFPFGEEATDMQVINGTGKYSGDSSVPTANVTSGMPKPDNVRFAWPQRSHLKGSPLKQMRLSPIACWERPRINEEVNSCMEPQLDKPIGLVPSSNRSDNKLCMSGFQLEEENCNRLICTAGSNQIVDACLFLGASFRVGWGPYGILAHNGTPFCETVKQKCLTSRIIFEKVPFDRTAKDEHGDISNTLRDLQFVSPLSLHMSMSEHVVDENNHGRLKLRTTVCNRLQLSAVCSEYEDMIVKQHGVDGVSDADQLVLRHQVMVWQLLSVLYTERSLPYMDETGTEASESMVEMKARIANIDPEAELLTRRADFSNWLHVSVGHLVQEEIETFEQVYLKELFSLLSGRQLDHAVQKAIYRGDIRLACLLSQAGGPMENRQDISLQLDTWESEGLDLSAIENDRLKILKLLSGNLRGALDNCSIDWKRFLGMLMWFHLAPDMELPYIINEFRQLVEEEKAPLPIPMYVEEGFKFGQKFSSQGTYDTAYYLMLLHASHQGEEIDISKLFSSASSTFDCLDCRMGWHQRHVLEAIGVLGPFHLGLLDMGFVAQLLSVGLISWAVYVVLHMPRSEEYPGLHEKVTKEILCQYCEVWSNSEEQQKFLKEDLEIPCEWLHEALAMYWRYHRDFNRAVEHLMKSSQWQNAHILFVTTVATSLFMEMSHEKLWCLASQFQEHQKEVENYDIGAGVYVSFYALKRSFDSLNGQIHLSGQFNSQKEMSDSFEERISACQDFFGILKKSEGIWASSASKLIRLVYARMAEQIRRFLIPENSSIISQASVGMLLHRVVMEASMPEDSQLCRLQDATSTFASWLSETVFV